MTEAREFSNSEGRTAGTRGPGLLAEARLWLRGFVFADPDGNRIDVGQWVPPPI
jgi:hypothetical protein